MSGVDVLLNASLYELSTYMSSVDSTSAYLWSCAVQSKSKCQKMITAGGVAINFARSENANLLMAIERYIIFCFFTLFVTFSCDEFYA